MPGMRRWSAKAPDEAALGGSGAACNVAMSTAATSAKRARRNMVTREQHRACAPMRLHFYLQASSRPAQLQAHVARRLQGNAMARMQRPARTTTMTNQAPEGCNQDSSASTSTSSSPPLPMTCKNGHMSHLHGRHGLGGVSTPFFCLSFFGVK